MSKVFLYIFVMALVTYLVRMVPFLLFRKKIASRFLRSFLYYIPYAVLGAMTIPDIFFSTGADTTHIIASVCGFLTAVVLSWFEKSLLVVSLSACAVVYGISMILAV